MLILWEREEGAKPFIKKRCEKTRVLEWNLIHLFEGWRSPRNGSFKIAFDQDRTF
jgi:hypothetical protein